MSLAPWGKTKEAMSLGEQEKVPELGGEVGCQGWLLSKLKARQDFGPLTSAPQMWGAQVGVGESPGLWGFLVTDRLCPVSPASTTWPYSIMHKHTGSGHAYFSDLEGRVVRNQLF